MERELSMPLGVVVARTKAASRWADWIWKPVAVLPGAGPVTEWVEIASGEGWAHFHAATRPLTLHRAETEAYRVNLSNRVPAIYVVLRREMRADAAFPYFVHDVTASAYDAQAYLDSDEDLVEAVPMPPGLVAWVKRFCDEHHVEETFVKRKRDKVRPERAAFGKEPIFKRRPARRNGGEDGDA